MRSTSSNLWRARRLVATSPDSGLRCFLSFLAIGGLPVAAPARRLDLVDRDADLVAAPDSASGLAADQGGLQLVQLEALAAQPAGRQEALVDVAELAAEGDKGAGADHAGHLAGELTVVPVL